MRNVLLLVLLSACPKRGRDQSDLLRPLLEEADLAWSDRGTAGFEAVENALLKGQGVLPESPELAWRWARLRLAQGSVLETEQERVAAYGEARSLAWACVLAEPSVRALEIERGLEEALRVLPTERHGCLSWATYAWVRWLAEFGADAGSVDLADLDVLTATSARILPDEERWLTSWSEGLLAAVRPVHAGRDLGRARSRLRRAQEDGPERLGPLIDLYRFVGAAEGDEALQKQLEQAKPRSPEDVAVLARVLQQAR